MAPATLVSGSNIQSPAARMCPSYAVSSKPVIVTPRELRQPCISRRGTSVAITTTLFSAIAACMSDKTASGLDFRMTTPDQTVEQAESTIRGHAQALLDVKFLIESEEWREAQRELRKNSAYLKQDIYTIIQSKDGSIRPLLRKLYSDLFNTVTKLDYAARDKDVDQVQELYNNMTVLLSDILGRI